MLIMESRNEAKTKEIGRVLGKFAYPGLVLALIGDLGAGKTVFVQGFAEGADVQGIVNSPSYVLMNIYHGRLKLFHFDFYRLDDEDELFELGLDEYFYGDGVALVEWADKFPHVLPANRLEIVFEKCSDDLDFSRRLNFIPVGELADSYTEVIQKYASSGY